MAPEDLAVPIFLVDPGKKKDPYPKISGSRRLPFLLTQGGPWGQDGAQGHQPRVA